MLTQKTSGPSVLQTGRVLFLPLGAIRPNPAQPRSVFDAAGLQELAASIRQYGVLQPLSVRKKGSGFELVAGERRLRAAGLAGLREVPCLLVSADDQDAGLLALVENLQRRDLDYIEQAQGLARLMQQYHLTQEQAARRVGKSQSAIANKLRLLKLSEPVLALLRASDLSERHARASAHRRRSGAAAPRAPDCGKRLDGRENRTLYRRAVRKNFAEGKAWTLRPARYARFFQHHQSSARSHPRRRRRRRNRAAGDRA